MKTTPIDLPDWVPPSVKAEVRRIEARELPAEQAAILGRLATDERMKAVWRRLNRRSRKTGAFVYPAQQTDQALSPEEGQARALGETLHAAFSRARDKVAVTKEEDVEPERTRFLTEAKTLRTVADELVMSARAWTVAGNVDAAVFAQNDAIVLNRVANWRETNAREHIRQSDDPMMITNERGDRVSRGVSIAIGSFVNERFGGETYAIIAILASVALNEPVSDRVARSAFSRRKRHQRS